MAANADYSSVAFESFEYGIDGVYGLALEDDYIISKASAGNQYYGEWSSSEAHSGLHSYKVGFSNSSTSNVFLPKFYPNQSIYDYGVSIKVWLKGLNNTDNETNIIQLQIENATDEANSIGVNFNKIARVGEWELYEAKTGEFIPPQWPSSSAISPTLFISTTIASAEIYIDDVMLKPLNAQVSSYVYDPNTLRIQAQFDDQNFGLFYQYNDEGKLIRKLIETERGLKSVAETQYNIPKVDKTE
jgi:hypothetical protein